MHIWLKTSCNVLMDARHFDIVDGRRYVHHDRLIYILFCHGICRHHNAMPKTISV